MRSCGLNMVIHNRREFDLLPALLTEDWTAYSQMFCLLDKSRTILRRSDRLAIRLVEVRRHLGEEFVIEIPADALMPVPPRFQTEERSKYHRRVSINSSIGSP